VSLCEVAVFVHRPDFEGGVAKFACAFPEYLAGKAVSSVTCSVNNFAFQQTCVSALVWVVWCLV
jgi:hypothetical protein